jgi:hypothetical protein
MTRIIIYSNEIQAGIKVVLLQLTIILPPEHTQQSKSKKKAGNVLPTELKISSAGGEIILNILVTLEAGITLTAGAPQKWTLELPGSNIF